MKMLPPQNIDAEKSALGAILSDQSVMLDVVEIFEIVLSNFSCSNA